MITKSAREIIKNAKTLANADNSSFTDFYLNTNLLNNAYREIYDDLIQNSEAFVKKLYVTGSAILPDDCYAIISVTDRAGNPVQQAPIDGHVFGWWIENGVFTVPKHSTQVFEITYATIPSTITAPDEWEQISSPPSSVTDSARFFCFYDGSNVTYKQNTDNQYCGKTLDITSTFIVKWGGNRMDEYVKRDGASIVNIQVHDPYMVISYSDGIVKIFTGWQSTEWNYNCIFGHKTRGKVVALKTDDTTGFGMVFYNWDDSCYYIAPFVPDTILSYPNNTLFTLLEYKIAFTMCGLLNMNVDFINKKVEDAKIDFYKSLGMAGNARRIKNGHRAKGLWV